MVNLAKYGFLGFLIFSFIILLFECFTWLIGHVICVVLGFTGWLWWFTVIVTMIVLNVLIIRIN